MTGEGAFQLDLIGSFRLSAPDGSRIPVPAKRSRILLAMLATSKSGERSRRWLQERIWGSRERANSQASLRRELSNLRPLVNVAGEPLLIIAHETVALNLDRVVVDVRDPRRIAESRDEFLEGIDIAWEEGFEDWLREERQAIESARETDGEAPPALPEKPLPVETAPPSDGCPTLSILVHDQDMPPDRVATLDRIVDLLAERIAALRWLPLVGVPARIDGPEALLRMGKALGVEYLLHCQLNPDGTATVALSQAASARLLWSSRHDLGNDGASCDPAQIANDSIAVLSVRIAADQAERVRDRPVEQLNPDELLWRARWHMRRLTRRDADETDRLLARAAQARPDATEVLVEQARADALRCWAMGAPVPELERLRRRAVLVRDIDPYDARAWLLLGILDLWLGQHESAAALMHESIRLEPSLASAYGHLGGCYSFSGYPGDGVQMVRNALRLAPVETHSFHQFGQLALAEVMLGDHRQAVVDANQALARRAGYAQAHVYKIAALDMAGDLDGACRALAVLRRAKPAFAPALIERLPFRDREWNARLRSAVERIAAAA